MMATYRELHATDKTAFLAKVARNMPTDFAHKFGNNEVARYLEIYFYKKEDGEFSNLEELLSLAIRQNIAKGGNADYFNSIFHEIYGKARQSITSSQRHAKIRVEKEAFKQLQSKETQIEEKGFKLNHKTKFYKKNQSWLSKIFTDKGDNLPRGLAFEKKLSGCL